VDEYIGSLFRRLDELEHEQLGRPVDPHGEIRTHPVKAEREGAAFEAGTVLLDAREAADRKRAEAEVAAAALVADAQKEAHRVLEEGRRAAEEATNTRQREIERDLAEATDMAIELRSATARITEEVEQWRRTALSSLELIASSLEQWPGTVPTHVNVDEALSRTYHDGTSSPRRDR
jgi:cell division septum initiation protein DivIVA